MLPTTTCGIIVRPQAERRSFFVFVLFLFAYRVKRHHTASHHTYCSPETGPPCKTLSQDSRWQSCVVQRAKATIFPHACIFHLGEKNHQNRRVPFVQTLHFHHFPVFTAPPPSSPEQNHLHAPPPPLTPFRRFFCETKNIVRLRFMHRPTPKNRPEMVLSGGPPLALLSASTPAGNDSPALAEHQTSPNEH